MSSVKRTPRKNINLFLFILIIMLMLVLVFELFFNYYLAPRMGVKSVLLESSVPLSDEELLAVSGLDTSVFYYTINPVEIESKLEALPEVRKALVEKRFPDSLYIKIQGRSPLALSLMPTDKGTQVVVFDQDGVVYSTGNSEEEDDLPVISGLRFEEVVPGMQLPRIIRPLLSDLAQLKSGSTALFSLISELKVVPQLSGDLDIVLFLSGYPFRALIEGPLTPEKISEIIVVCDALKGTPDYSRINEIDFRAKEIVYHFSEEGSVGR